MVNPRELRRAEVAPQDGEARHPAAFDALGLAAGGALGLLVTVIANAWVGAAVGALACALIAAGHGGLLGALLGGALGAAGVAASSVLTRWSRGETEAVISAGLDLYRIPLLAVVGAAVGWGGDFARRAVPPAGRLAARAAGGVVVAAAVVAVLWAAVAAPGEPMRYVASRLASGPSRGSAVGDEPEPLAAWEGVALDIPVVFYPGGYVSSFQSAGPGAVPGQRRVQSVETVEAVADDVFAWYLDRCAEYGFAETEGSGEWRRLSVADPEAQTGMVTIEVSPGMVRAQRGRRMVEGTRIVLLVHPPEGEAAP